jgi:hypothetical protein
LGFGIDIRGLDAVCPVLVFWALPIGLDAPHIDVVFSLLRAAVKQGVQGARWEAALVSFCSESRNSVIHLHLWMLVLTKAKYDKKVQLLKALPPVL